MLFEGMFMLNRYREGDPMPGRIHVLDEGVINRIAAGEVIDRPVSVVKELVENSIDADATAVRIDIEQGGRKLIRVMDNGVGMSHDDAFLALERHATSKLRTEKDLVGIGTMGFRGEALASIASVSRLRLRTCDESGEAGSQIVIEGGVLRDATREGMARGTVAEVHNLFFNVPVRRRFLKSPNTEADHVHEFVSRMALAFPRIAFKYTEDGKVKLDTPPVKSTLERIRMMYSKDVRENLIEVNYSIEDCKLHGYVAKPPYVRSNARAVQTFVNSRAVRDRMITSAVSKAFSNLMERGRYPFSILFLELPPDFVDVNVHPQKAEVRFRDARMVYELIVDGVHEALTGAPFHRPAGPREPVLPQSPVDPLQRVLREGRPAEGDRHAPRGPSFRPEERTRPLTPEPWPGAAHQQAAQRSPAPSPAQAPIPAQTEIPAGREPTRPGAGRFSALGVVGTLPGSFLVLHSENELIVMDHHAAHERILFEDLKRAAVTSGRLETQDLLMPCVLEFAPLEARAVLANLHLFRLAGFRVEQFGEHDFVVKGLPVWLGNVDPRAFFQDLVDAMLDTGANADTEQARDEILKKIACTAAVKETNALHPQEIHALLKDLDRVGSIEVCPHGRPIMVRFPFSEIRRKMGRK